ncbi:MAG: efflux RND transporter periplasmic adaptor subunit [Desulfovibrio sp.]|jgi:membrane fusion protein (multidrug efflux system)|nr:efflux RND transporter periplasmic adaptor subunit [Desulfovibrio sp.]
MAYSNFKSKLRPCGFDLSARKERGPALPREMLRNAGSAIALCLALLFSAACDKGRQTAQSLPEVTYIVAQAQNVALTSELPGRTSACLVAEVRPQVSGIILQRLFAEGSEVKQGDVLYQIDPALYQAAYDNAEAGLKKARANLEAADLLARRYSEVVLVNAVSRQDYDNALADQARAEAELKAALAALEAAAINLQYTRVTAPISGRIGRSSVTPGALVTQNQPVPLAVIQKLDPVYVDVTQSSAQLLRLKKDYAGGRLKSGGADGTRAALRLEDGSLYQSAASEKEGETSQRPIYGLLKFSEVNVEQSTGTVTIRAVFQNPDGVLLPGMYVRAVLEEGILENAILLPREAIVRNNRGQPVVRLLTKNSTLENEPDVYNVNSVILDAIRAVGDRWLVPHGVKAGDLVLFEEKGKLQSGKPVKATADK